MFKFLSFLFDDYMADHVRISAKGREILKDKELSRKVVKALTSGKDLNKGIKVTDTLTIKTI